MLQPVFKTVNRRGFTLYKYDFEALSENAQYEIFGNSCCDVHCLNHLYTVNSKPAGAMQLGQRGHNFSLPAIHLEFIVRVLFYYVWLCFTVYMFYTFYMIHVFICSFRPILIFDSVFFVNLCFFTFLFHVSMCVWHVFNKLMMMMTTMTNLGRGHPR